jgi:carbon monoxide dehydrogenase subunit G
MSNAVTTSIQIDATPEEVWDVVMDAERLEEWVTIHRRMEDFTDSTMNQVLCIRGVSFHVKWELAEGDRPHHAKWKGKGPARSKAETEYTLTAADGGTRFEYRNEFKAPLGPLGAAASKALVGGVPEREANASLQKLKKLLEKN